MGTPAKGAFFGQTNYFAAETPRSRMAMAIRMVALDSKSSRRYRRNVGNPEQAAGLVGDLALAREETVFLTGADIAINGSRHMPLRCGAPAQGRGANPSLR